MKVDWIRDRLTPGHVSLLKTSCEGCRQPIHTHELIQRLGPFQYRHARCAS